MTDYSGRYDRLILDVIRKRFEANAGTWGAARENTVLNCLIAMFNAPQIVRRPRWVESLTCSFRVQHAPPLPIKFVIVRQ
jgi:phosphoribosyl 1,2-cyclic phosphodiesterase